MKTLLTAFALLTVTAVSANASTWNRCSDEWGVNYRMMEHCVNNQTEAEDIYYAWNGPYEIREFCEDEWSDEYGVNYWMGMHCMETQYEAYERLYGG